jgi:protein-disulfide isomerase
MASYRKLSVTVRMLATALLIVGCLPIRLALADAFTSEQRTQIVQILRQALKQDPSILRDAIEALQADDTRKKDETARASIAKNRDALFDPTDPVAGNPHGDVTIVEFFDPRCPYCRRLDPIMTQFLVEDRGIRLVYKDLPILGPPSLLGSRALLAAQRQGAYQKLRDLMMSDPPDITIDSIHAMANQLGLDWTRLQHDMDDPGVEQRLDRNIRLARMIGIDGTPALIIGQKMVAGVDMPAIEDAITQSRHDALVRAAQQKAATPMP